ncbi:hypothetical protein ACKKBF_B03130 [Auxenochlorella protothecoides x Auxenochlorella symbiontica]
MASAVLTPLVTRLLRSFIRSSAESRGSTLKVSFSSRGTLLLHNLELDLDALVPGLRVHKALARALEITIPWAGLSSQPIQVVLTAVDIEVGPEPASADAGPETKAQQTNLATQAPHEGGRGPGWLGGALQGWLLRTLCNMQVTLKHVSLAWVGANGSVAARCAFQSLEFYTDPSLVADMEVPEAWLGKCLSLTNLSFSMREASGGVLGPLLVLPHASLTLSSPINAFIEDWDEERCGDDPLLTELGLELQDPTLSLTDGQLCTLRTLCSECAAAFEPRGASVLEREDSQPPARTLLREQSLSDGDREESLPLIPPIAGPDLKKPPGGVASRMWGYITNESAAAADLGLPDAASVGSLEAASILAAWAQVAARVASRVKASLTMQAIHACFGVSAVRPAAAAQPTPAPAPGDVVLRMGQGVRTRPLHRRTTSAEEPVPPTPTPLWQARAEGLRIAALWLAGRVEGASAELGALALRCAVDGVANGRLQGGAAAAHPDGATGPVWDEVLALRPPQDSENEIRGQRGAAVRAHFQSLSGDGAAPAGREASKEARGTSLTLEAGRLLLAGSPTALAAWGRVAAALRGEAPAPSGGGGRGARSDGSGRADTALSDEWPGSEVPRDAAHGNTAIWPCTGGSLALSQVQLVWGLPAAWILLESSCLQVNIGGDEDADGGLGDAPSQAAAKTNLKAASSQLPVMRLEVPVTRLCVVPRLREPCADSAGSGAESLDASPSLLTSALVLEACVRGMHLVSAATTPLLLTASAAQLAALAGNHPDEVYMALGKNVLADGAQHTTTHSSPLLVWDRPWLETLQLQLDAARLEAVESDSDTGAGALGSLPTQHRLQLRSAGITATLAEGLGALEARLSGGIALEMLGRALAAPAAAEGSIRGAAGGGDGSAAGQTSGASGAGSSHHEPGSTWSVAVPASSLVLSGPPGIEGGTQAQLLTLGPGRVRCSRDGALAVEVESARGTLPRSAAERLAHAGLALSRRPALARRAGGPAPGAPVQAPRPGPPTPSPPAGTPSTQSSLHLGRFELELQPEGSGLQGVRLAAQACCVGWGAGTEVTLGSLAADLDPDAAEPHHALLRVAAHSSGAPALRLLASSDWEHSGLGVHLGGVDVALTRAALTACRGWAEALAPVDDPPPLPASASHLRASCDRLDLSLSTTAGFQEQEGGADDRCDALPSKLNACTVRFQSDELAVTLVSTPASENRPWMPAHTSVSQADATVLASQLSLSYPGARPGQRHMALLLAPTDLRLEAGVWPLGPRAVQVHAGDLTSALSWRDLEVLASMARALGRGDDGAMEAGRSRDGPAGGSEDVVLLKRDGDPAASGSGSSAADSSDDLTAGQFAVAACAGREILPSQIQGWSVEMEDAIAQHHLLWRYPRPRHVACLTFRAQASHVVHAAFGLTAFDPGLPAPSEESKNAIPLRLEALGDDGGCSWRIIAAQPALPAQCHQLCWRGPLSPHALLPSLRINPPSFDSVDPLPPLSAQTSLALRAGRLAVALHEYGPEGRPPLTSIHASGLEAGWHAFPDGAWAARLGGEVSVHLTEPTTLTPAPLVEACMLRIRLDRGAEGSACGGREEQDDVDTDDGVLTPRWQQGPRRAPSQGPGGRNTPCTSQPDAALPLDVCELPLSCEAPQQGRTSLHVCATTALRVNAWQWTPSALSRLSGLRRALPPALVLTNATPVAVVVRQAGAEEAHLLGSGEEAPFAWPLPPAVVPGARRRLQLAAAGAAYHKGAAHAPGPETARWSEPVDAVTCGEEPVWVPHPSSPSAHLGLRARVAAGEGAARRVTLRPGLRVANASSWTLVGLLEGGVAVEQAGAEAGRGGPWLRIDPGASRGAILTLGAAGPSPSLRVWLGGGWSVALDLTGSDGGEGRGSQVLLPDARVQPQPPPPELAAACAPVGALLAGVRCRGGVGGVTLAAPARLRNGLGVPVRVRPVVGPEGHRGDAVRVLDPGASCDLAVVPVGGIACVVESAAPDPQPPGGAGPGSAGGEQDRGALALVATPSLALVFPPLLPSAGGPQPVTPSGSPLRTPPPMGGFRSGGATPAFVPPPGSAARVHLGSTPCSPPAPAPCQLATTCAPGPLGVAALVVTLLPRFLLHNLLGAEAAAWGCGLGDGSAAAAASAGIGKPGAPFLHPSASAVLACDSDDPPGSDAPAPPLGALRIAVRGPGGLVCRSEAVSLAEAGGERAGPWTRRLVLTSDADGAGAAAPALELHVLLSLWREDHHGAAVVWHASLAPALHVSNASEEALEVQAEGAVVDFSAGGSGAGRAGPWQRCLAPGETRALLLGAPRTPGGGEGVFGPRLRFARSAPRDPLWGPAICASHALGRQRMHLLGACDEAGGEGARAPLMASWRVVEVGNRSHLIVFRDRQPPGVLCNATSETLEVGIFLAPSESKAGHSRPSLPHTVFQIPPGEEVEAELLPHRLARPGELRAGSGQGPLSPRRDAAATGPSGTAWDDSEDEDAFLDCLQAWEAAPGGGAADPQSPPKGSRKDARLPLLKLRRAGSGEPWAHPLLLRPGRHELARGLTVDVARRCAGLRVAFCSAPASLPPKAPPCQRLHADLALAGLELCLWDDERGLLAPPPRRGEGADPRHSAGREVAALALRGLRLRADLAPCLRGEGVEVAADLACRALQLDALAGEGRTVPVLRTAPVRSLTGAYDAGRGSGNLGGGTASASLRDAPWAQICVRHVPGEPPLAPSFRNAWVQDARLALPPLAAAVDDGVVAFARRVLGSLEAGEAEHGDASLGFEDSTTPMSPRGALHRALTAEAAGAAASRLYVASCMVQPISVLLDVHLAAGTAGIPVALDTTSAPLSFSALAMRDALFRPHVLARGLAAHALAEALLGAPRMLGSLALLLNPTGLVRSVQEGVGDLVGLPWAGLSQGSASMFLAGLGLGSASLLRNLSGWTLMSVSGFSYAVARAVDGPPGEATAIGGGWRGGASPAPAPPPSALAALGRSMLAPLSGALGLVGAAAASIASSAGLSDEPVALRALRWAVALGAATGGADERRAEACGAVACRPAGLPGGAPGSAGSPPHRLLLHLPLVEARLDDEALPSPVLLLTPRSLTLASDWGLGRRTWTVQLSNCRVEASAARRSTCVLLADAGGGGRACLTLDDSGRGVLLPLLTRLCDDAATAEPGPGQPQRERGMRLEPAAPYKQPTDRPATVNPC